MQVHCDVLLIPSGRLGTSTELIQMPNSVIFFHLQPFPNQAIKKKENTLWGKKYVLLMLMNEVPFETMFLEVP